MGNGFATLRLRVAPPEVVAEIDKLLDQHCDREVASVKLPPRSPHLKAYVSYCTSFRLCNGENRLLGPAASMAFENRALFQRLV